VKVVGGTQVVGRREGRVGEWVVAWGVEVAREEGRGGGEVGEVRGAGRGVWEGWGSEVVGEGMEELRT
jgi:hypothetical protein